MRVFGTVAPMFIHMEGDVGNARPTLIFFFILKGEKMNRIIKEKKEKIDNFVKEILSDAEKEKIDLADYEYLLSQLRSNIEFLLRYN